jgi:hypothetical protein
MNTLTRFLQLFSLGTWIGAILFFSAIVTPAAFSLFPGSQAGDLVNLTLGRLHLAGMVCGVVFLTATAAGAGGPAGLLRPAPMLVLLMVVLTFVSQFWVSGNMAALRAQAGGSLESLPAGDALRASFERLHRLSVRLEIGVLLAGIAAMVFASRTTAPALPPAP